MLNTICIILISIILLFPFVIKFIFGFNDYFGFIMGIRYLAASCFFQAILATILPGKKNESSDKVTAPVNLTFNEKFYEWIKDLLQSIVSLCVLYYCVAKITKPTQNYNLIFMFVSAMIIPYIIPFGLYMFLPAIGRIEGIKKLIDEGKVSEKYFSEEYAYNIVFSTIFQLFYEIGIGVLIMLVLKKLVNKSFFLLNYFSKNIFKLFITCFGLAFLEKYYNYVFLVPFVCGMYLYCQKRRAGQLTNRFKEESEMD